MEYYSILKEKEILQNATTWLNMEGIMLSEMSVTEGQMMHDSVFIRLK